MNGLERLAKRLLGLGENESVAQEKIDEVKCAIEKLSPRQKTIIQKSYGIDQDRCYTSLEIAAELAVTSTRVEDIAAKAMELLQQELRK